MSIINNVLLEGAARTLFIETLTKQAFDQHTRRLHAIYVVEHANVH